MARRDLILRGVSVETQTGLEIGPLHDPIVQKTQGDVFYIDHCSTAELRKKYDGQIPAEAIREVDLIWTTAPLRDAVGGRVFDYAVASHVIEHVPDMIGWLNEIAEVLKPGGMLCLAIPDRRYTFDYLRPLSTVGEILDAYFRSAKLPTTKHLYDNYTMACHLDTKEAWRGTVSPGDLQRIHPPGLAREFVRRALEQREYIDCHCWVFTPESFMDILIQLTEENLLPFTLRHFQETRFEELEFFAGLQRN